MLVDTSVTRIKFKSSDQGLLNQAIKKSLKVAIKLNYQAIKALFQVKSSNNDKFLSIKNVVDSSTGLLVVTIPCNLYHSFQPHSKKDNFG